MQLRLNVNTSEKLKSMCAFFLALVTVLGVINTCLVEAGFTVISASDNDFTVTDQSGSSFSWSSLSDEDFTQWYVEGGAESVLEGKVPTDEEYIALNERVSTIIGLGSDLSEQMKKYVTYSDADLTFDDSYIFFDLSAGSVTIKDGGYSGSIYTDGKITTVSGKYDKDKTYYIYQSTESNYKETGWVDGKIKIPSYAPLTYNGMLWSEYITNNNSVEDVISNWNEAFSKSDRTSTGNNIEVTIGKTVCNVVIDNIYSTYAPNSNSSAPLKITSDNGDIYLKLKGDSRFRNIYYKNSSKNVGHLYITSYLGDGYNDGSVTVAALGTNMTRNNSTDWPDCLAVIGAAGSKVYGLTFSGGTVFAGFPAQDDRVWNDRASVAFATCVGAGNNNEGEVTVNGGRLTAVSNGTSPPIGGGGGYNLTGNAGFVNISGGAVYAYASGIYSIYNDRVGFVPTTAIGGSSTFDGNATDGSVINITGGYVYAESLGGTAIGGGSSRNKTGGSAAINISGGTVVAKSTEGYVRTSQKDETEKTKVEEGNAIGGGCGTAGAAATVNISGGNIVATSVGGGSGTSGNGGAATVTVTGGSIDVETYVGGGTGCTSGANVNADGGSATMYVTGGYIHTGILGGGDTDSTYSTSHKGYARVYISGGEIQGQFLLVGVIADENLESKTEAEKAEYIKKNRCEFIMTGGRIYDTDANNETYAGLRENSGGAVWMDDKYGIVTISGGVIEGCTATNGGAVYMTNGTFTLTGSGEIKNCTAAERGGAVYLGGGRAVVGVDREMNSVSNHLDTVTEYTTASENKDVCQTVSIDADNITCAVTGCKATNGGALYVSGMDGTGNDTINDIETGKSLINSEIDPQNYNVYISGGSISNNTAENSGGAVCVNNGHVLMDGGSVSGNSALAGDGGAVYLSSNARSEARVRIRSGVVSNNHSGVSGGAIAVEGVQGSDITLKVTIGVNESHYDSEKTEYIGCDHINVGADKDNFVACPTLENNTSVENGGAIHITGGSNTLLNIYCLNESGNDSEGDDDQSNFMMVEGGVVVITTGDRDINGVLENGDAQKGYTCITGSIHVVGGSLDIYGHMANPKIDDVVTVDLQNETDHFQDHRVSPDTDEPIYWIHYHENFPVLDADGNVLYKTGRFKAYPIESVTNYVHTITGTLFDREGYVIRGWNTDPDGNGNYYSVGDIYTFPDDVLTDENGVSDLKANEEGNPITTLTLYAIWERVSYKIRFSPNTTSYSGTMADFSCSQGKKYNLPENSYSAPGKRFICWNTKADGSGTDYADMAEIIDLTTEENAVVTLYAKWTDCDHKDGLVYSVSDNAPNTIVETCGICGGHTATAKISALNADYDGNTHLASVAYSSGWMGSKSLPISYTVAQDDKLDSLNDIYSSWNSDSLPVHAGDYTASISVAGTTAHADYKISRVKWATPDVPKLKVDKTGDGEYVTVTSPTGADLEYRMTYTADSNLVDSGWQSESSFKLGTYNIFHYFHVAQKEDRDHIRSDERISEAFLSTNGIFLYFIKDDGIKLTLPVEGTGTVEFSTQAAEGYHLRDYDIDLTFDGDLADAAEKKIALEEADTTAQDGVYKYSLTGLDSDGITGTVVTVTITGVRLNASVTAKTIDGEYFGDFNDTDTVISHDSAYTVCFTVNDCTPDEYSQRMLSSGTALPEGTTIIMKTEQGDAYEYWYYIVPSSEDDIYEIDLSLFSKMGSKENKFSYDTESSDIVAQEKYHFIVNFDQVDSSIRHDEGDSNISLKLVKAEPVTIYAASVSKKNSQKVNHAPQIPDNDESHASLGIKTAATFELKQLLSENETPSEKAILELTSVASEGKASIWNERSSAVVLTYSSGNKIPADLTLTVKLGDTTSEYIIDSNNRFIIPLSSLDEDVTIYLELSSGLNGLSGEYNFTADWNVAYSGVGNSPVNGYTVASGMVEFNGAKTGAVSLRIDGATKNGGESSKRLYETDSTLYVNINYLNVPDGCEITAELLRKNTSGKYIDTAYTKTITDTGLQSIYLGGQTSGNFCLRVTISKDGENLLQVPYYFILLKKGETGD